MSLFIIAVVVVPLAQGSRVDPFVRQALDWSIGHVAFRRICDWTTCSECQTRELLSRGHRAKTGGENRAKRPPFCRADGAGHAAVRTSSRSRMAFR